MSVNVHDFGAVGDGVTDDRFAFQAALTAGAGGAVWVPPGTYALTQGAGAWCLTIPANTQLVGLDAMGASVLLQASGIGANVRTLQAAAPNIVIAGITLDGNAQNQVADEHRAGIFAVGAVGIDIHDVVARNHTGDGIEISIGSNNAQIWRVTCTANHRNGLTFGGGTVGGKVSSCHLFGNVVQQLDTEPGATFRVDGVEVEGCTIGPGQGDYAMTVAGGGPTVRSSGWNIHDNDIDGSLEVVWADDIKIHNNAIVNSTNKPTIQVYRICNRIDIRDNELSLSPVPGGGASGDSVIAVTGTGVGQQPDWVTVERNRVASAVGPAHGVHATCVGTIMVFDNVLNGAAIEDLYASGVYARTTVDGAPVGAVIVHRNRIRNWGAFGVSLAGNGAAAMRMASVIDNLFIDDSSTPTMNIAMSLPIARDLRVGENTLLGGCVQEQNLPFAGANMTALPVTRWTV